MALILGRMGSLACKQAQLSGLSAKGFADQTSGFPVMLNFIISENEPSFIYLALTSPYIPDKILLQWY